MSTVRIEKRKMPRPRKIDTSKPPKEYLKIGKRLEHVRKQCGLSQAELGEKVGLSQRAISEYECGWNRLSLPTLLKITNILGVSLEEFNCNDREEVRNQKAFPTNRRVLRHLKTIEQLPRRDQEMIFRLIDNTRAARDGHRQIGVGP